jgi:hypothetical protein
MAWATDTDELAKTTTDEAVEVARTAVEAAGVETTLETVPASVVLPDEAPSKRAGPGIVYEVKPE